MSFLRIFCACLLGSFGTFGVFGPPALSSPVAFASAGGIDTSTVTPESQWYSPDDDWEAVTTYMLNWQGKVGNFEKFDKGEKIDKDDKDDIQYICRFCCLWVNSFSTFSLCVLNVLIGQAR